MHQWYYVQNGKQEGPVYLEQLRELASAGKLATTDLIWNADMRDWTPAGEIDGIFNSSDAKPAEAVEPIEPAETIDTEVVGDESPPSTADSLPEIEPASEPLDIGLIINRVFELTKRHFVHFIILGAIAFAIVTAINTVLYIGVDTQKIVQDLIDYLKNPQSNEPPTIEPALQLRMYLTSFFIMIVSLYLSVGIYRFIFKLLANQTFQYSMIFTSSMVALRCIAAQLIITVAVIIGTVCFIIPGIYIALRLSQVIPAIIDREMNITDAISYSAAITKNNLLRILALWIIAHAASLIVHAMTCNFGLIITFPMMVLGSVIVFRYLQSGRNALTESSSNPPIPGSSQ